MLFVTVDIKIRQMQFLKTLEFQCILFTGYYLVFRLLLFLILYTSVSQTFLFHRPLFTLDTSFSPPKPDQANTE